MEQLLLDLTSRIAKLERMTEALRATEQRGLRAARVYHNVNQTWTAGLTASVAYNAEVFDFGDLHDNTTNNSRITVPIDYDGYWIVTTSIRMSYPTSTAATDYFEVFITKNGSSFGHQTCPRNPAGIGATTGFTVTGIINAVAGDYFETYVANGCAGNSDIVSLAPLSAYLMAVRIQT